MIHRRILIYDLIIKCNLKIYFIDLTVKVKEKVAQSCLTLFDPMDYTVHGILQARILERAVFPFSSVSSQLRDQIQVSRIGGGFFTSRTTGEVQEHWSG